MIAVKKCEASGQEGLTRMSEELTKKAAEEDDLALDARVWRSQFQNFGVKFANETDTVALRNFASELVTSCEEHLVKRMVCICSYPTVPDVNDLFSVTYRQRFVSAAWLRWGGDGRFLFTPMIREYPFTTPEALARLVLGK